MTKVPEKPQNTEHQWNKTLQDTHESKEKHLSHISELVEILFKNVIYLFHCSPVHYYDVSVCTIVDHVLDLSCRFSE